MTGMNLRKIIKAGLCKNSRCPTGVWKDRADFFFLPWQISSPADSRHSVIVIYMVIIRSMILLQTLA